jgi:hypothetical protein
MPALVAGIHVLLLSDRCKDVDGRDKPGHDGGGSPHERSDMRDIAARPPRMSLR